MLRFWTIKSVPEDLEVYKMKARVIVGALLAIGLVLVFYVLPPVVLPILMMAVCLQATKELMQAAQVGGQKRMLGVCMVFAALVPLYFYLNIPEVYGQLAMFALVFYLFVEVLHDHDHVKFVHVAIGLFAAALLPYMLTSLVRIFFMDQGKFLVLMPFLAAWGSDTCALFAGMLFGKHKLAPVISPKKTIEGAAGGVVGSTVLMVIYATAMNHFFGVEMSMVSAVLIGIFGSILGQIGDLSFSIIKRNYGIKDYSHLLPGHGGILDRFDSVIFVAPVVEVLVRLFG